MMKKMMSWGMGLLLLASCSQNEDVPMAIHEAENIRATVPCFEMGTAATRALTLDEQKGLTFIWSKGDVVGVFSKDEKQQIAIYMNSEAGKQTATFSSKGYLLSKGGQYKAYYPIVDKATAEPIIPVDYTGQQQSGNNGYSHLSAKDWIVTDVVTPTATNQADFMFQHVGVILRLIIDMPSAGNWSKLTLSADDKVFTTKQNLDLFGENLIVPTEQTNSVSLALNDVTTTEDNKKLTAWMMLSPVDFTSRSMTVTVSPETGDDVVFTITPGKNFVSGKAYSINVSNVDHSKNPLLKWAESDLVYNKTDATSSFATSYTTQGSLYQWGRNTGWSDHKDALGVFNSSNYTYGYGTYNHSYATATGCYQQYDYTSLRYTSISNLKGNKEKYFMTHDGTDYWVTSAFGDGGSTWQERAEKCGFETSVCPEGWRLPTKADFLEIKPTSAISGSEGLDNVLNNYSEVKEIAGVCKYAIRWSATTINNKTYLRVDALVVPNSFSSSQLSTIDWANNGNVVTRYFGANGFIHAFYHNHNVSGTSFPVARPMPGTETHTPRLWQSSNGQYYTVLWDYITDYSVNNEGYYWMSDDKMAFTFQDNTRVKTVEAFADRLSVLGFLSVNAQDCCAIRCVKAE